MAYIFTDRAVADAATLLVSSHGEHAFDRADSLANASRDRGNVHNFCHWRQVARMIAALSPPPGAATLH